MLSKLQALAAYAILVAGVLLFVPGMGVVGALALLAVLGLGWGRLQTVPRAVMSIALALTFFTLWDNPALLPTATANATRLAAMILSVMLFSTLLSRFRDLKQISANLFAGRPIARYLNLSLGTNLLSVPLNLGAVALMGTLIQARTQQYGDSPATRNAVRAVIRGFGTSPIYSPLSVAVVLTLTLLPNLEISQLLLMAFPFALLVALAGLFWREAEPVLQQAPTPSHEGSVGPWLRFMGILLAVCAGVFLGHQWLGWGYARAVLTVCLIATAATLLLTRLRGRATSLPDLSQAANELAIIGGSALIGAILSTKTLALLPAGVHYPAWIWPLLAAAGPWVMFAGGLAGVSPILTGTLIGSTLGAIWPVEATLGLGLVIVTGWGLSAFGTPFGVNALMMERMCGYPARKASYLWNRPLSLFGLITATLLTSLTTAVLL